MTAYEGIVKRANVTAGQRVFINGGSSSVGAIAIQLAKQRGATVVTCCSTAKLDFVQGLGADLVCIHLQTLSYIFGLIPLQILDYRVAPLVSQLAKLDPFDVVMDCIGTISLYAGSPQFLKPKRPYIAIGIDMHGLSTVQTVKAVLQLARAITPSVLGGVPRKFQIFTMVWDEKALKELADMVDRNEIHVPIDGEYGWEKEDVMKAYERQMSARVSRPSHPRISLRLMTAHRPKARSLSTWSDTA
jgi:NADPH:quinone reductase-like Zn-dependent oxidoreductase